MRHDDDKVMDDVRRRIPINGMHRPSGAGAPAEPGDAAETEAVVSDAAAPGETAEPDDTVDDATGGGTAEPVVDAEVEAVADDIEAAADLIDEGTADIVEALAAVLAERDQYLDALQRLKAEFENYRKRSQREVADAGSRARAALLAEFLPVLDNLDRALSAAEHHEQSKVLEGVRLTHNLFADLLRKEGVVEVEALGRSFDPTVHEALMTQESDDHEEGTVTAVLQRGYTCGDRVLRPAKVAVSSGPSA